jgi:hypothetical protein
MADRTDAANWVLDPTGRHQLRFHDGAALTQYVSDFGVVSIDMTATDPPQATTFSIPEPTSLDASQPSGVAQDPNPPTYTGGYLPPPYASAPSQWGSPMAFAAPTLGKSRRVGLWVAVGAAIVEGAAVVILSVALIATHSTSSAPIGSTIGPSGSFSEHTGQVVYTSSFGVSQGWSTGAVNANTNITLSHGRYVVTGSTQVHHALLTPYGVPQRGISIETSATNYPDDNVSIGVGCQSASGIVPSLVYQWLSTRTGSGTSRKDGSRAKSRRCSPAVLLLLGPRPQCS